MKQRKRFDAFGLIGKRVKSRAMNTVLMKKGFICILALVLTICMSTIPAYAGTSTETLSNDKTVTRYSGDDRYHTSHLTNTDATLIQKGCIGIIVCSGENGKFADALCASGLAGKLGYPIVLTNGSSSTLDSRTCESIETYIGSGKVDVIILGGENTISANVANELGASYDSDGVVTRICGDDRYATSEEVYLYGENHGGWPAEHAILTKGNDFPDALSAASYCATKGAPILLTDATSAALPFYVLEVAAKTNLDIVIVGGTNAVSSEKENPLTWYAGVERIGGNSRYETNQSFVTWELSHGMNLSTLGIATGETFPDALSSGYFLSMTNSPLLLVSTSEDTNANVYSLLENERDSINSVLIFGGTDSVTQATEDSIKDSLVEKIPEPTYPNDIVRRAYESLGIPYVWGGCSATGFDCSGLVSYCVTRIYYHKYCTYDIYYNTDGNWMNVSGEPQPGDIWVYDDGHNNGHTGVYIGDGQFIEAPHTGDVVKISPVRTYGKYMRYIG